MDPNTPFLASLELAVPYLAGAVGVWLLCLVVAQGLRGALPRWSAPALVRRLVEVTTAAVLTVAGLAEAAPPPPGLVPPVSSFDLDDVDSVITEPREADYVVRPGDSLWSIAAGELTRHEVGGVVAREILPYWKRLIDANRGRIRSGDPDLIFPGEELQLPPVRAENSAVAQG